MYIPSIYFYVDGIFSSKFFSQQYTYQTQILAMVHSL